MAITASKSSVHSQPNVTPMIDVMLVLLIIFMVVTPALLAGFNAVPPQGVNLKDHPEVEGDQVLGIDAEGIYYLNKKPIQKEDLPEMLKTIYDARTDDKVLYVKAHKDLEYSKVIDALDVAGKNGVRVVGMISEQKAGTQSTVEGDTRAGATPTTPATKGGTP
jgi:biopolymer transport protein TolR